jgi:predicted amidophosphoribosyltransferase
MPPAPPARARARRSPVAVGRDVAVLLLDLLAPPRCLACRSRGRAPWCPGCGSQVRVLAAGCARCGTPRGGAHRCWTPGAPISTTTVAYDYHGPLARGLATAKLAGAHAAWPALAAPLASRLAARPPDVDVVTWITTPAVRVRARGLDHAQRLAVLLGTRLGLPVAALLEATAVTDGVDRYRAATRLPGTEVLLVDDILTTGATAWRAATTLQQAGAGRVHLAVLARAGTHALGP